MAYYSDLMGKFLSFITFISQGDTERANKALTKASLQAVDATSVSLIEEAKRSLNDELSMKKLLGQFYYMPFHAGLWQQRLCKSSQSAPKPVPRRMSESDSMRPPPKQPLRSLPVQVQSSTTQPKHRPSGSVLRQISSQMSIIAEDSSETMFAPATTPVRVQQRLPVLPDKENVPAPRREEQSKRTPFSDLPIMSVDGQDYLILKEIGKGGFSTVSAFIISIQFKVYWSCSSTSAPGIM